VATSLALPTAAALRQRAHWSDRVAHGLLLLLVAVLVVFLALPLATILAKALQDRDGAWVGLANFASYLGTPALLQSFVNSISVAALVTLVTVDLTAAIIVAIIVIAVQQLEGNFLSPVVLGRSLRLHGLVVLVALTAGTILGGIIGTLLAVPTAAVAWAVIKQWNDPIVPEPGVDTPEQARTQEFEKRRTRR
jgi:predicted PurR-regulated permease PerM